MEEYIVKVYSDRTVWHQNGKVHRLDGPAIEHSDGDKEWHQKGKRHRIDGPAVEYANGTKSWFLNSTELTEKEFNHLAIRWGQILVS